MRNRVPLPKAALTRIAIMAAMVLAFLLIADVSRVISAPPAQRQTKEFALGDVLVAVAGGKVEWHNPDGSLYRILDTTLAGTSAGLAFNPTTRNLFVTNSVSNTVAFFDPAGNLLGRFGAGYEVGPTSILFDASGNVFVGLAGGLRLVKLDANGRIVSSYKIAFDNPGFTWIDLAPDQCTMYYTTNGTSIKRFDVCRNRQLPDYADLPGTAYALRLLPGGGLLVADSQEILRLDANGKPVQIYAQGQYNWFGISLDPDGKSFWSTDLDSNRLFKFDLASRTQPFAFKLSTDAKVGGLAVFGESTAAQPTPAPTLTFTPAPAPTLAPIPTRAPTLTFTPAPTATPIPTQTPTPLPPPPTLLPARPPILPTPPTPTPDGFPGILLVGGLALGGLASLVVIAAIAIAVVRRPARPNADRSDRVERADSQVQVQSRDDPGRQIVEPKPHPPSPSVRFSLGQGEVNYVIETTSPKKPKKE